MKTRVGRGGCADSSGTLIVEQQTSEVLAGVEYIQGETTDFGDGDLFDRRQSDDVLQSCAEDGIQGRRRR